MSIAHDAAETPSTVVTAAPPIETNERAALVTSAPAVTGGGAKA
jgi:hypothetical protein